MTMRMKLAAALLAVLALAGCGGASSPSHVHHSASSGPAGLPSYSQWQADVKKAVDPAIPWLRDRVKRGGSKLAIVLDIDNTALETQYHAGAPNKPVRAVAAWARAHHVAVLFVTRRDESVRATTMRQLSAAGYQVDSLCMRVDDAPKQVCRRQLTEQGYTITADIGNRSTDFDGGYYEKAYKLPDYNGKLD